MSIIFQADKAQGINAYYGAQRCNTDGLKRAEQKKIIYRKRNPLKRSRELKQIHYHLF